MAFQVTVKELCYLNAMLSELYENQFYQFLTPAITHLTFEVSGSFAAASSSSSSSSLPSSL